MEVTDSNGGVVTIMVVYPVVTDAPTFSGPPQGQWTYADWEKLPDDGNIYEIIGGVLYMTRTPGSEHQGVITRLIALLGHPALEQNIAWAYTARLGVIMPGCDPVEPDFSMIKMEDSAILEPVQGIYGMPDLLIEILSSGNRDYDEQVKLEAYAQAGVPEFGIIDPNARVLRYYRLIEPGKYAGVREYGVGETVTFKVAPTIPVAIADLFSGAPDTTP
jgi:Uma2 family endonuclease